MWRAEICNLFRVSQVAESQNYRGEVSSQPNLADGLGSYIYYESNATGHFYETEHPGSLTHIERAVSSHRAHLILKRLFQDNFGELIWDIYLFDLSG